MTTTNDTKATNDNKRLRSLSEESLRACVHARVPVMLVSEPGMAKTATVRALAEEMGYELVVLVPSRQEPQDVSGFPTRSEYTYTDDEGNEVVSAMTEYAPQSWQREIMEKKKVLLFIDEFSNATPGVRASYLSMIQDREFPNGDKFPEEVAIVGAMNPTSSAADGYELDPATCNRIAFISWKPGFSEWAEGMKNNFGRGEVSEQEQEWRERISSFIMEQPGALHKMNDGGIPESLGMTDTTDSDITVHQAAWPSRRSWDNLARVLGTMPKSTSLAVQDTVMQGLIGREKAMMFRRWVQEHAELDVPGIIRDPDKFKDWKKLSIDNLVMILTSAIDGASKDNIYNVLRVCEIMVEIDKASVAAPFIYNLSRCHHDFIGNASADEKDKIIKRMFEVVAQYSEVTKNED